MDCIFCKIINGVIPSYTIYENDYVKAFLDVSPASNGHTLIVPKKHFENIYDIHLEYLIEIEKASKEVSKILKEKLSCQGITRLQNNEYGQEVKHYHMHIIPRYENDNLEINNDKNQKDDPKSIYDKIV